MKKILALMGRYYPKASPNSICMQNIIDELPREEYTVDVLCYEDGLGGNYDGAVYKFSRGLFQSFLYKSENSKTHIAVMLRRIITFLKKFCLFLCVPIYPWGDPITTYREYRMACKLQKKNNYDMVIGIYMPLSSLITAHKLKKKNPDMKYIAYFPDALSGGSVPRFLSAKQYEKKAVEWEKKLLSNADEIIFMESVKEHHRKIYTPEHMFYPKITYLDLPMLRNEIVSAKRENDRVTLLYVGSLPPGVRSPAYILKVFSLIPNQNAEFIFIGDDACKALNDYAKTDGRVRVLGRCRHDEAVKYEKGADVLVNLGNFNANLTPSKIFEYMSFGKKIISTYSTDEDSGIRYLKKYPKALLLDARLPADEAKEAVKAFIESEDKIVSYAQLKESFRANTPEAFIALIRKYD